MTKSNTKISILGTLIWFVGALFFLYEFFLRTFLGALASQIIPDLHLNANEFAFLASLFYIAYGIMQIPAGAICEKIGVKNTLIVATSSCALASFWFAGAESYLSAAICRFIMGAGGGFAFLCLLMITIDWFPKKTLGLFIGLGQFIGTMGALLAAGPLASLVTSLSIGWREIFFYIGLSGVFLLGLSLLLVKNKTMPRGSRRIRLEIEEPTWHKFRSLFLSGQAWFVASYSALVFLSVAMLGAVWGTIFLQTLGYSQGASASVISFAWLGFAIGCPLLGGISDYLVLRKPIMAFCAFLGLILACVLIYLPLERYFVYCLGFFLLGITSAGQSIGFAIITEHVKESLKPIALGLNSAFITILAAIVPLIVSVLLDYSSGLSDGSSNYSREDFLFAFSVIPILYVGACVLSFFFIKETYCRAQMESVILKRK